jgi:EAL domain-containing protein (putative c-di-GMP-specific phosphodiesterase class I)
MNARSLERLTLEMRLRGALDRGELLLLYQPFVSLRTGRVVGAEALLRWRHDGGLRMPADFIAIAEDTGLIVPIGEWALRKACHDAKGWLDAGLPHLGVAVNLSALQFRDRGLAHAVRGALEESGLPPQLLKLEITESAMMHDAEGSCAILEEFKSIGVGIAMDDFGTGYSSLAYLRRFPIDQIKIDSSFVRDLEGGRGSEALALGIVALARSMGLQTVAEGVETRQQRDFMRAARCDMFQGYLFSPPVAADRIAALLDAPEGV